MHAHSNTHGIKQNKHSDQMFITLKITSGHESMYFCVSQLAPQQICN